MPSVLCRLVHQDRLFMLWRYVNLFVALYDDIILARQSAHFFESSPLKWLSTSSRLSGFLALVITTE
jgi:hypothetical protein